ncbi:MAG TPA: 30S ribosomal protein S6 [Clostridium sp.]|jgi:small subunit ribosomal protein S6|nr:30S ribosomal protein S6 [Clostridium sp.]
MLNKYESIFVISPELDEETTKSIIEKIKNLIESEGELENIDEWGKRKLAYPIDYLNEGYYVLMNFAAKPEFPQELERVYKITEGVIKNIIIKKDN